MNYLITGATGFLGPYLIGRLLKEGHTCRCLVRSPEKARAIGDLGAELISGDITRPESLAQVAHGMDRVLHLATLGHMSNFEVSEAMFDAVNVQGALNMLAAAKVAKVPRFVHCSSMAAMGICPDNPATEASVCRPHHPYGRSKLKSEQALLAAQAGPEVVVVRFSMIYGPGDPRDILKLTRMARKGFWPQVGRRPKLNPLIHARDAVEGLLLATEKGRPGQIYLITNAQSESFDRIRAIICDALGAPKIPFYVPEWLALGAAGVIETLYPCFGKQPPVTRKNIESILADRVFSIRKAQEELGFVPRIDPEAGLQETVCWYREQGWV